MGYQPFSAKPAILGSYIAAVALLDDYRAITILEQARVSSPNEPILNNNYACSLAALGRVDEAANAIGMIDTDSLDEGRLAAVLATYGLIGFRMGRVDKAREFYERSTELLRRLEDRGSLAIAYAYWAREESYVDRERKNSLVENATKLAQDTNMEEILEFIARIE